MSGRTTYGRTTDGKAPYGKATYDSATSGRKAIDIGARASAVALAVMLSCSSTGCETPDIDSQTFRCETNDDCGPGWQCNTEPSLKRCIRAYDATNGVYDDRLVLGLVADLSDSAIGQLGKAGAAGYRAFFERVNATGGVHGRRLELAIGSASYLDAAENEAQIQTLLQGPDRKAFALAGVLGTGPSLIGKQLATTNSVLFFGPATGADELEPRPPNRYVFNVRLRHSQEAAQLSRLLIGGGLKDIHPVPPGNLAVFAQGSARNGGALDDFGRGGVDGVKRVVSDSGGTADSVEVAVYTLARQGANLIPQGVPAAVNQLLSWMASPDRAANDETAPIEVAVVLAALGDAAAAFTRSISDRLGEAALASGPEDFGDGSFTAEQLGRLKRTRLGLASLSSVGLELLQRLAPGSYETAESARRVNKRYGAGMVIASPMPSHLSNATGVRQYRKDLAEFVPDEAPGPISLEGYVYARLLHAALDKHGRDLTTESFIATLETLSMDVGIGTRLRFSPERHQATEVVWGLRLDEKLSPQPLGVLTDLL